jgi:hypothetical protein
MQGIHKYDMQGIHKYKKQRYTRHVIYRSDMRIRHASQTCALDKEHLGGMERAAEGSRATGSIGEGWGMFWGDLGRDDF